MSTILLMLSPRQVTQDQLGEIQKLAPEKKLLLTEDREEIEKYADEIEVALGWVPHDLVSTFTNLRWFQQWGAGADWLLSYPEMVAKEYILTNTSGLHAVPISEHILAMILAFGRDLPRAIRSQANGEWLRHHTRNLLEVAGKTVVLVGVGAIGARTAAIASALGMRVLGVRRNPDLSAPGVERMFGPDQMLAILPEADFVVLTIPLTPETRGMIGRAELIAMKPSARIINIGRGGTIQEAALVQALQEGWIAGAGLDVFETEPLPLDSPLWGMEQVIITSHYSGQTPHYSERGLAIFIDNLRRYQAGEPLSNVVDRELGY